MRSPIQLFSLALAGLLFPGLVLAQERPESPAPGRIELKTEPPPPPSARTYHMHDGFYLRVNFGIGALRSRLDDDGGVLDLRGRGFALGVDLLVGGSPARGVAVGGALLGNTAFSTRFEQDGFDVGNANVSSVIVGPFIDGFFSPTKGWHAGGAVGLAAAATEGTSGLEGLSSVRGFGGAAWVGHDFWVADDWSVGIQYRFSAAVTADEVTDIRLGSVDLSILNIGNTVMFTGLYH